MLARPGSRKFGARVLFPPCSFIVFIMGRVSTASCNGHIMESPPLRDVLLHGRLAPFLKAGMTRRETLHLQELCAGSREICQTVLAVVSASTLATIACCKYSHRVLVQILGFQGPAAESISRLLAQATTASRLEVMQHVYGCRVVVAALKNCSWCGRSRDLRDFVLRQASAMSAGCGGYVLQQAIWEAAGSEMLRKAAPALCALIESARLKPKRLALGLAAVVVECKVDGGEEAVLANEDIEAALGNERCADYLLQLLLMSTSRCSRRVRALCSTRKRWGDVVRRPFAEFPELEGTPAPIGSDSGDPVWKDILSEAMREALEAVLVGEPELWSVLQVAEESNGWEDDAAEGDIRSIESRFVAHFCLLASLGGRRKALQPFKTCFDEELDWVDGEMLRLLQAERQSWQAWVHEDV